MGYVPPSWLRPTMKISNKKIKNNKIKQTAVEWLLEEFQEAHKDFGGLDLKWLKLFKKAKNMEMLQIIEAFDDGFENQCDADLYYSKKFKPDYFKKKHLIMTDNNQPVQEKKIINTQSLKNIAIYLSGVKDGKGDLLPLGTIVLEDLWDAVKYLEGDVRFIAERDGK